MENAFLVTPMSQSINLNPGEVYTESITVANPASSAEDLNYVVSVSPYGVVGESYDADLATMSDRSMIKEWIKIDAPTGTLKPNESQKVTFTITVPKTAPSGGQYAAITVTKNSSSGISGGVAVDSEFGIASLIYANVAGETIYEGEILENNIPGFVINTPVTVSSLLSNNGNVHQVASVDIDIKNILTGDEIFSTDADNGDYNELIMPGTKRLLSYDIEDLPVVGIVEIKQSVIYSSNVSTEIKNVIICPIWFMILVVAVMAGVIWGIVNGIKKIRKRKSLL